MIEWISELWGFLYVFGEQHKGILIGLTIFSFVAFIAGIVLTPVIIVNMSADYFIERGKRTFEKMTAGTLFLRILKNIAGIILIPVGIVLLFIPGPGWLTIIFGVTLADFPFKYKVELWLIRKPWIKNGIDSLRRKYGHEPLQLPE
ncbi:MAG: hypothetical protein JW904_01475 [Spirochaetales bacterium]|nr:hypothetical protein [Spirochaetales bacterium]